MTTKYDEITNSEDIIDSRDVIARIDWLEGTEDAEEQAELKTLLALQEEAEGYAPDWRHGAPLIRGTYFADYAQQLAEDIGGKEVREAHWPFNHIDWEAAAEALKEDYTAVDFDGEEYWIR